MDSEPEAHRTSSLAVDIPATRPVRIPLRFAIGEMRFLTLGIKAQEVLGHFLEQPRTLSDLMKAHTAAGGTQAIFGRSIILSDQHDNAPHPRHQPSPASSTNIIAITSQSAGPSLTTLLVSGHDLDQHCYGKGRSIRDREPRRN